MENMVVYVADIGSIKKSHFGWCRKNIDQDNTKFDKDYCTDIGKFVDCIVDDLNNGKKVAIGFECPLFVPITEKSVDLTKPREGENNRPWSAGAGCGALATGLTECVWIFERIYEKSKIDVKPTFKWKDFYLGEFNFFIWEAFVGSSSKGESKKHSHCKVAQIAVNKFVNMYPEIENANCVYADHPYSLVGAGLLRAKLTTNQNLLFEKCIVIKS